MSRVIAIHQGRAGPPVRNDRFLPVIALIREHGLLDRPLLTPVCSGMDHAEDVRKSIYLAARYYCSCGERLCTRKHRNTEGCPAGGQRLGVRADIVKDRAGKLRVQVTVYDKTEAMRQVIATYGPDPSRWPYHAKAKRMKTNA